MKAVLQVFYFTVALLKLVHHL